MGQTLSHGVYLPNEGERNCYAGLASNWQILNTAVGNIAEKAPLVHTHGNITNDGKVGTTANLPLITGTGGAVQAGSFGTSANTFCEGNDSRLSDARTPLAHTHTKSDVTDLLNSNFIPSANNSYNLGSSSYQWNNVYSKRVNTQTLNGINPGALGLPSGNYDPISTNGWDLTGATSQSYTPAVNGWLFIAIQNIAGNYLSIVAGRGAISMDGTGVQNGLRAMLPVIANESVAITVKTSSIFAARFYPVQGNVS